MEPSLAFAALGIGAIIAYLMAEFIGRQKHIGGWWSFIVVLGSLPFLFIPGILMVVSSPSAKGKPTAYSVWRLVIGAILLIWAIYLFVIYATAYAYPTIKTQWLSWAISSVFLGIYMVSLGLGNVINMKPKYRSNLIGNWLISVFRIKTKMEPNYAANLTAAATNKFYILKDGKAEGPFDILELQGMNLMHDARVCRNGEDEWKNASEYYLLANFINYRPPQVETVEERRDKIKALRKDKSKSIKRLKYLKSECAFGLGRLTNSVIIGVVVFFVLKWYYAIVNDSFWQAIGTFVMSGGVGSMLILAVVRTLYYFYLSIKEAVKLKLILKEIDEAIHS